jgi:hypothetical protein
MPEPKTVIRTVLAVPARTARLVEFLFRRRDAAGDLFPDDPAEGTVPGSDPDHILFLGERGELSLGVRTHELSLPAFFARTHAERTGRGVSWSIAALPASRIQDAPAVVERQGVRLHHTDMVVILVGITDALRATSPATWDRNLRATLDALTRGLPIDARILIGAIPPLDNAGSLSRPARIAAGILGRVMNLRTRILARDYPNTVVVDFPRELTESVWRPESEEHRYRNTYQVWGKHLAEPA